MRRQHEALRVPAGWTEQDRALVIQLERILDELYNRFGRIGMQDLSEQLREWLEGMETELHTHNHDDRYYTEAETDTLLAGKSNVGHTHDDRYYTEAETDTALGGKADKSATVSNVAYDSTNKKITKTVNGTTTDVVTVATVKSAMAPFTWGQIANK